MIAGSPSRAWRYQLLLRGEGPAFPRRREPVPARRACLAAGLPARDPRALEPAAAAGAVQRGVQRDPHPGTVISPPGQSGTGVAAATVTGWLIIQIPVFGCDADPLARMM
jgi:hypothetical protein